MIEADARKFWNAATFIRRAPDRDQRIAVKALEQLSRDTIGKVSSRSSALLKDIRNGTDTDPPRAD